MSLLMAGQEQPWRVQGPLGPTTVVAFVFAGDSEPVLDNGALHARSKVEAGVRFSEEAVLRRGERVLIAWLAESGGRFVGATTVELWVDRAAGTGWKRPIDHVNRMSAAVRGTFDLAALAPVQRASLAALLARLAPAELEKTPELRA